MDNKNITRLLVLSNLALATVVAVGCHLYVHKKQVERDLTVDEVDAIARDKAIQAECLAFNVFHEARGESRKGQEAVAWVTMNRVSSDAYPNNICDVVKQKKQFSWYKGPESLRINWKRKAEVKAWKQAQEFATDFLAKYEHGRINDPTRGAMFYHNADVRPYWIDIDYHTVTIGNHTFYRKAAVLVASR